MYVFIFRAINDDLPTVLHDSMFLPTIEVRMERERERERERESRTFIYVHTYIHTGSMH